MSRAERGRSTRNQLNQWGHKTQETQEAKTSTYYCVLKIVTSRKKNETKAEHQSIVFTMNKKQVDRGKRGGNKAKNGRNRQPENTI